MICLIQNTEEYNNDLRVMLMAFYPGEKIVTPENISTKNLKVLDIAFTLKADFGENAVMLEMLEGFGCDATENGENCGTGRKESVFAGGVCEKNSRILKGDYHQKEQMRNPIKLALYDMLCARTGKTLPWGSLTGVRPTKIAMQALESGMSDYEILQSYTTTYSASAGKAQLCIRVAHREKELIDSVDEENEYCLYVGIPFCPTRCLYCSFTSYPVKRYQDKIGDYLDAMEKEMKLAAKYYGKKRLISVYVGGGTPSAISACHLDRLCTMLKENFDFSAVREFTVEAGRPDSTTYEKMEVLKRQGVTRISINPQTMNEETLKLIGRAHTPKQAVEAFYRARKAGFDNINMDLIVGLPGENREMVENTLKQIKQLKPESLTVHSLAIKRAANLNQNMELYKDKFSGDVNEQLELVTDAAETMNLAPYYLYRQKNIAGNLENIGFSADGLECLYNILIMEERTDIIGLGAGSSSKLIRREGAVDKDTGEIIHGTRIDRIENCKSVDDYIERIDEMLERKRQGFAKC